MKLPFVRSRLCGRAFFRGYSKLLPLFIIRVRTHDVVKLGIHRQLIVEWNQNGVVINQSHTRRLILDEVNQVIGDAVQLLELASADRRLVQEYEESGVVEHRSTLLSTEQVGNVLSDTGHDTAVLTNSLEVRHDCGCRAFCLEEQVELIKVYPNRFTGMILFIFLTVLNYSERKPRAPNLYSIALSLKRRPDGVSVRF